MTDEETKHRMTRRRSGWDYCAPADYMVTLTLADRSSNWLGRLEPGPGPRTVPASKLAGTMGSGDRPLSGVGGSSQRVMVPAGLPAGSGGLGRLAAGVSLTALGEAVAENWLELPSLFPGIETREYAVMPEHFHGIIRVLEWQEHPLGQIVGAFKSRSTGAARRLAAGGSGGDRPLAGGSGEAALAGSAPPPMVPASLLAGSSLWSEGYCDSILWGRERYEAAAAYIAENPVRAAARLANPQFFVVRRDIAVALDIGGVVEAHFSAVGNDELLHRLDFHQVQCSRRFFAYSRDEYGRLQKNAAPAVATDEFRQRLDDALAAAKDGAVLVNPCISQGEKEIARRAFAAGAEMIVLKNQGFSPSFRPEGVIFSACDAGRLLLLAPGAWPFRGGPRQHAITREDACTLNRLAQAISRDCAVTIDYKGREPRFIDEDARRAVTGEGRG